MSEIDNLKSELEKAKKKIEKFEHDKNSKLNRFFEENRKVIRLIILSTVFVGIFAHATFNLPHVFAPGQTISASQVNDNFNAITNKFNGMSQTLGRFKFTSVDKFQHGQGNWDGKKLSYSLYGTKLKFSNPTVGLGVNVFHNTSPNYTYFQATASGWYEIYVNIEPMFYRSYFTAYQTFSWQIFRYNASSLTEGDITTGSTNSYMSYNDGNQNGIMDGKDYDNVSYSSGSKYTIYLKTNDKIYLKGNFSIQDYSAGANSGDYIGFNLSESEVIINKI